MLTRGGCCSLPGDKFLVIYLTIPRSWLICGLTTVFTSPALGQTADCWILPRVLTRTPCAQKGQFLSPELPIYEAQASFPPTICCFAAHPARAGDPLVPSTCPSRHGAGCGLANSQAGRS